MKHVLSVVLLGAGVALGSHWAWYDTHRPGPAAEGDYQLSWMKSELRLTDGQYARIASLYRDSGPRLTALASEVADMRAAYAAFERTRVSTGQVDFLAFADFLRRRRELDRDCRANLREFVATTSGVMTPAQRARYARVVGPALEAQGLDTD